MIREILDGITKTWTHLTFGKERNEGSPDRIYVSGNQRAATMKRSPDDVEYIKVSIMEQTMERMRGERSRCQGMVEAFITMDFEKEAGTQEAFWTAYEKGLDSATIIDAGEPTPLDQSKETG